MANSYTTQDIEKLSADIGENIYIDIAKWHLYLSDAHLHTTLAEQVYPLLEAKRVSEAEIEKVLAGIRVKLGGGRREVPLIDLIPTAVQGDLVSLLEKYQNNM